MKDELAKQLARDVGRQRRRLARRVVDEPLDVAAIRLDRPRRRALLEGQKIVEPLEMEPKPRAFVQAILEE